MGSGLALCAGHCIYANVYYVRASVNVGYYVAYELNRIISFFRTNAAHARTLTIQQPTTYSRELIIIIFKITTTITAAATIINSSQYIATSQPATHPCYYPCSPISNELGTAKYRPYNYYYVTTTETLLLLLLLAADAPAIGVPGWRTLV